MQSLDHSPDLPGSEAASPSLLILPPVLRQEMFDHALAARPLESVGLLATDRMGSGIIAVRWFPGTNVDASPMRYTMDRNEVEIALDRIAHAGWSLGAIVHSHPVDPAVPSPTDRREHRYPDTLMGIISLAAGAPELRVWSLWPDGSADGQRSMEIAVQTRIRPTSDEEYW